MSYNQFEIISLIKYMCTYQFSHGKTHDRSPSVCQIHLTNQLNQYWFLGNVTSLRDQTDPFHCRFASSHDIYFFFWYINTKIIIKIVYQFVYQTITITITMTMTMTIRYLNIFCSTTKLVNINGYMGNRSSYLLRIRKKYCHS